MNSANEQLSYFHLRQNMGSQCTHAVLTGPKMADGGEKKSPVRLAFDPVTSQTKIELRLNL